jgi:hypothetical protein
MNDLSSMVVQSLYSGILNPVLRKHPERGGNAVHAGERLAGSHISTAVVHNAHEWRERKPGKQAIPEGDAVPAR